MTRDELYRRQAEEAARKISEWPDWMQRGITPPREEIRRLVPRPAEETPVSDDAPQIKEPGATRPLRHD